MVDDGKAAVVRKKEGISESLEGLGLREDVALILIAETGATVDVLLHHRHEVNRLPHIVVGIRDKRILLGGEGAGVI